MSPLWLLAVSAAPPALATSTDDAFWPVRLLGCEFGRPPPAPEAVLFGHTWATQPGFDRVTFEDTRVVWLQRDSRTGKVRGGQGYLAISGYAPLTLSWSDGLAGVARCEPAHLELTPPASTVSGVVTAPAGGSIEIVGCRGYARVTEGPFTLAVHPGEDCQVWARVDGEPWGRPVDLTPAVGDTADVRLSATPSSIRDLGVDVALEAGSLVVTAADPWTMLRVGDVLIDVNGEPLEGPQSVSTLARAAADRAPLTVEVVRGGVQGRMRRTISDTPSRPIHAPD